MKDDLISRDALKNAFKAWKTMDDYYHDTDCNDIPLSEAFDLIDNVPTVEPCYQTTSCLDCENYDKENHNCPRYCEVIKEVIKSRPQGMWIPKLHASENDIFVCSACGRETSFDFPFCPWCGVKTEGSVGRWF